MVLTRLKEPVSEQKRYNASRKHHSTPQKSRIREGAFQLRTYGNWNGISNLKAVFQRHSVSKSRGYAILRENPQAKCCEACLLASKPTLECR